MKARDTHPETEIETVEYQATAGAAQRPCHVRPCDEEFPGMPSRWCSWCLIAALLTRLTPERRT